MGKVAVAGASGRFARQIIPAIVQLGNHQVVALTRAHHDTYAHLPSVELKVVDYTDHGALVRALQGCDTVISTIFDGADEESSLITSQLALVKAAHDAGVTRFAPSDFGIHTSASEIVLRARRKTPVVAELRRIGMAYTNFRHGVSMNYFSYGSPRQEAESAGLPLFPVFLDVPNRQARVPGSGATRFTTMELHDVGKFVAAALDLDTWPEESYMVGSTVSFDELIDIAERTTGLVLERTYISLDELRERAKLPGRPGTVAQILLAHGSGMGELPPTLNGLCPQVKPVDVESFIKRCWNTGAV